MDSMTEPVEPLRRECPGCHHKALVTRDGELSLHYTQGPGVGLICDGSPPSVSGTTASPFAFMPAMAYPGHISTGSAEAEAV